MSKTNSPRKIRVEDFPSDQQALINKLSYALNNNFDEIYYLLNGAIDFDNLNRRLVSVVIKTGVGKLLTSPQIRFDLIGGKVRGISCVSAVNNKNPSVFPTSSPFISYTFNDGILTILHVSGLQDNSEYTLTLELIG